MKIQVNMTTSYDDVDRFADSAELARHIEGFDGLELMWFGESDLIRPEMVVGVHLSCPFSWYGFWVGDEERLLAEYDDLKTVEEVYGGLDPHLLVDRFKQNMRVAHRLGAEYVVYHVSECTMAETLEFRYGVTDEQVVAAAADLVNQVVADEDGSIAFMLENQWCPGMTLLDPGVTREMVESVHYANKGIMFDTGHALHTNFDLRTQEEGLAYLNGIIDAHERAGLLEWFRGMHLQQSLTGDYCKQLLENPVTWADTYSERFTQAFKHVFKIDRHEPFTCPGVRDMIDRLPLEYLTFEFITTDSRQHAAYLQAQREALGM